MSEEQKRQHFRLEFPPAERPKFHDGKFAIAVFDISEGGCSLLCDDKAFAVYGRQGTKIQGKLQFADGDQLQVVGEVLRVISEKRVAVRFSKGVSFAKMMAEHRRIMSKYSK